MDAVKPGVSAEKAAAVAFEGSKDEREYLASSGVSLYNSGLRPRRDNACTIAYCLLAAITVFWGIGAFTGVDPNLAEYTPGFYLYSPTCDISDYKATLDKLQLSSAMDDEYSAYETTSQKRFNNAIAVWLPITAVCAIASSALYVILFRRYAQAMVTTTIVASLAMGYIFAIICLASGAAPFGIILIIISVALSIFYWWIRDQLKMCAKLLAIAGRGLRDNWALIPTAIGIKVVGLGTLIYMVAAFFCALNVGSVQKNPYATRIAANGELGCLDEAGLEVPCCRFETKGWASFYAFLNILCIGWTTMLVLQIKLYTVADTMSQWYFAPSTGSSIGSPLPRPGSVKLALRNCLTSSFGSVAFAAAILAVLRALRRMMERAARNNIICCILNCLVQPLLAMAEKFTRFATIAAAITGDAFVPAAKGVFDTLKRNFLQTYSLWWVPDMVLNMAVLLFALSWGGLVFFATVMRYRNSADQGFGTAFGVAFVCFACMYYVLHFIGTLLLDIVNTLYICYAMDKDARCVTHQDIHDIYQQVPTLVGSIIENPDGNMMYGAPDARQQAATTPSYPSAGIAMTGYPQPQAMYAVPAGYSAVPAATSYPSMASAGYPQVAPAGYSAAPVQPPPYAYGTSNNV